MSERVRKKSLRVRMTDEEREMLGAVANSTGLSVSDWVRLTIRQNYAQLTPAEKRKAKK